MGEKTDNEECSDNSDSDLFSNASVIVIGSGNEMEMNNADVDAVVKRARDVSLFDLLVLACLPI